ncbi:Dabb family protein [Novosphingobium sp. BL-52-GroH]|uniref:Dabb family protein n=1 Tax=Novosphingobium sp. BL-52-GroH TaxID=3349877 RepID=UPI00384CBECF
MITHLVLARWNEGTTADQVAAIKAKAPVLLGIEGVETVEFHANLALAQPAFGRGIQSILIVGMRDRAALERYGPHPLHAELGAVLMPHVDELTITDYESE